VQLNADSANPPLTWTTEFRADGVMIVSFRGRGGVGSAGNPDGAVMRQAVIAALAGDPPTGLIVDFTHFEYSFGD